MEVPKQADRIEELIDEITDILKNKDEDASLENIDVVVNRIKNKVLLGEDVDREHIKALIMKHPYFKNPNHYYVRLITIMKYLKKKGVDVRTPNIDLVVDDILLSIQGVKKIGTDRYSYKK